jgi:hypothetical protein
MRTSDICRYKLENGNFHHIAILFSIVWVRNSSQKHRDIAIVVKEKYDSHQVVSFSPNAKEDLSLMLGFMI